MINNDMYKFFIAAALSLSALSANSADMWLPVRSVADGDTIRSVLNLPCPLCNVSIRIIGIDTPESNHLAKCPAEKAKGIAAKEFLKTLVGDAEAMLVKNVKWDKYGGRINATVEINGIDIAQAMITEGFARPYYGSGPKPDWCK